MNISKRAATKLKTWRKGTHTIAVMGEYSSGKSTFLNLLLDQIVIPTKVTVTDLPPIWLTYGKTRKCWGLKPTGALVALDLADLGPEVRRDFLMIRMEIPAAFLKKTDVIDTPGISDPKLVKGSLAYIGDFVDFVIWCSAANQAWRQSEKAAWTAFPEKLRDTSLLVLTRADKMRNESDLAKVMSRCASETNGLFQDVLSIASTKAIDIPEDLRNDDADQAWAKTGAPQMFAKIADMIMARPAEKKPAAAPKKAKPAAKPAAKKAAPVQKEPAFNLSELFDETLENTRKDLEINHILQNFSQCFDKVSGEKTISKAHQAVLSECLVNINSADLDPQRLYAQVAQELKDFSNDSWCDLHPS